MTYRHPRMTKEQYQEAVRASWGVLAHTGDPLPLPEHGFVPYGTKVVKKPRPYLVDPFLREGDQFLVSGKPKTLKTRLMIVLAISVATGAPFLGQFTVPERRRVALILLEDERDEVEWFITQYCNGHEIDRDELVGWLFLWCREDGRISLNDPADLLGVGCFVAENNIFLLGLDNWVSSGEDSNVGGEIRRQLNNFADLRTRGRKGSVAGMVVHEKQSPKGGRLGDRIRGSGDFAAWYDVGIFVSRTRDRGPVKVEFDHRYQLPPNPFFIEIEGGGLDEDWTKWSVADTSSATPKVAATEEQPAVDYRPALVKALYNNPRCSLNKLYTTVTKKEEPTPEEKEAIRTEFETMVSQGIAGYEPSRKKGSRAKCWLLVKDAHDAHKDAETAFTPAG